jgi:hypothetical protein
MKHVIFDTEIIGSAKPVFLICGRVVETKESFSLWGHKRKDIKLLRDWLARTDLTWVGFNSENFDRPLIAAALEGADPSRIKQIATNIIEQQRRHWATYKEENITFVEYDHIDLMEVAPGVMISLKTYAGRMGYPTMVDMPVHHDKDPTPKECKIIESYCQNDLGVTEALFHTLKEQLALRDDLSAEYGIDLRSKSDAQIAEAILKKRVDIQKGTRGFIPSYVEYRVPDFCVTDNNDINIMMDTLEQTRFELNRINGSVIAPEFLANEIRLKTCVVQCGIGGLHSSHDYNLHVVASDTKLYSDFDVASYYPNIMLKAGLTPNLEWGKDELFIKEYEHIYNARMAAKRAGLKAKSNSLKIVLNGTFGKLGSVFCSFYAPQLMLAVTLTGQMNLLCLMHEMEKSGAKIISANTDGIMVEYTPKQRARLLKVIATNSKRTGFEYEETPYSQIAIKDVNNYIAITTDGKVKAKGLYGDSGVNPPGTPGGKNPTMEVCSLAARQFLIDGTRPEAFIKKHKAMKDFVAIRGVTGGGIQHDSFVEKDDWELVEGGWTHPGRTRKPEKRKSRPAPRLVGVGGVPFGRVARWYMTTKSTQPLTYLSSGNTVPKSEGAMLCMTLPDKLPADLNYQWYIDETRTMMRDIGIGREVVRTVKI